MKKIVTSAGLIALLVVILGADIRRIDSQNTPREAKKRCVGYTIIEYGKGLDCNGDTLKLVRVNGVQVLAENAN